MPWGGWSRSPTRDVSLPAGTTNPVPIVLTANNIPFGTVFTIRVIPQLSTITSVTMPAATGTFETATTTATVTLPTGQVSVLNAFGSFTLPQLASLLPLIDGEPVDRVMVAATHGDLSTVTLLTKSGKEVRPEQLPLAEQVKLTLAFETFAEEQ